MTISVPSTTTGGAGGTFSAQVIPNPAVTPESSDFFGKLYSEFILPVATNVARQRVDQELAISSAKAQAKINQYHAKDPSIGPNDPRAALAAANQTTAQRYLPSFMLAPVDPGQPVSVQNPQSRISPFGWALIAILAAGVLWAVVRIFRR
jgi:hypothetical protein